MALTTLEKVKSALRRLELSENEQAVYLSLLASGQASARTLSARTGITRPSTYDQLKNLIALGLVVELEVDNTAQFAVTDGKHLSALLSDRIDRLEQSRDFLEEALPELRDQFAAMDPKVRTFEGAEGMKQLLKDVMWHDNETLKIIWATTEMRELFADTFLRWFDDRRAKRILAVHALWPAGTKKTAIDLFTNCSGDQTRIMPRSCGLGMTTIIYGQKVANITSSAESLGFIVESNEYFKLQSMQFAMLWRASMKV